jgi:hypothetical protein
LVKLFKCSESRSFDLKLEKGNTGHKQTAWFISEAQFIFLRMEIRPKWNSRESNV